MSKISVVVLAGNESHADLGRMANALSLVREAREAGDEVELVFDGAGTTWIPELENSEHDLHGVYEDVRDHVAGACEFCAGAFGVREPIQEAGVPFLSEFEGHPSLRSRVEEGYQVVTF